MKKRAGRIKKVFMALVLGLAVAVLVFAFWLKRGPTTQLVDAAGRELTAGDLSVAGGAVEAGSPFDEPRALIADKKLAAAKDRLLRLIEESDRDAEACVLLCEVSRELNELEAAVDYGLKATQLLPYSAEAHLVYAKALGAQLAVDMQSIGGMFLAMKRMGLFKAELDRVIELDPRDTEARKFLVFTNLAPRPIGDIDRAIELCGEIEAIDPVLGKRLLATCYQRQEQTEQAIALLRSGIEEFPDDYSFHVALADIYATEKRFEDADAMYEAARLAGKGSVYYRSLYGQARMRIQNKFEPSRAVELLDEFIADEPEADEMLSVAHACWRKGNALEQLGRVDEAIAAYEESLRRDPGFTLAKKSIATLQN